MATLTTRAVITAHDRLTGPLNAMAGRVQAINNRLQQGAARAAATSQRVVTAGRNMSGASSTGGLLAWLIGRNEHQYDRALKFFEATTEASQASMEDFEAKVFSTAQGYRKTRNEIMLGAQEAATAGIDRGTITNSLEYMTKVAIATNQELGASYGDITDVIMSQGFAFRTAEEQMRALSLVSDTLAVGVTTANQTWQGFMMGLKQSGPIMKALRIPIEQQVAMLGVLADAGLKGEQGGAGLKTMLARSLAPTKQMRGVLAAHGIDPGRWGKFDSERAFSAPELTRRLEDRGLSISGEARKGLLGIMSSETNKNDQMAMSMALQDYLSKSLDIDPGDVESQEGLRAVIAEHFASAIQSFDLTKWQEDMAKMSPGDMAIFAGKHRLPHGFTMATSQEKYLDKLSRIMAQKDGAIDRRYAKMAQGFAHNFDLMASSFDVFMAKLMASGFGDILSNMFAGIAKIVNALGDLNPRLLKMLGLGLVGTAVFAPLAIGIGLFGNALALGAARLVAFTGFFSRFLSLAGRLSASPFMRAGKALTALALGMGVLGKRGAVATAGLARIAGGLARVARFAGPIALLMGAFELVENWDAVSGFFDKLMASEGGQHLAQSWERLSAAFGSVASKVGTVVSAFLRLFNIDTSNWSILGAFETLAGWIGTVLDGLTAVLQKLSNLFQSGENKAQAGVAGVTDKRLGTPGFTGTEADAYGWQLPEVIIKNDDYKGPSADEIGSAVGAAVKGALNVNVMGGTNAVNKAAAPSPRNDNGGQHNGGN